MPSPPPPPVRLRQGQCYQTRCASPFTASPISQLFWLPRFSSVNELNRHTPRTRSRCPIGVPMLTLLWSEYRGFFLGDHLSYSPFIAKAEIVSKTALDLFLDIGQGPARCTHDTVVCVMNVTGRRPRLGQYFTHRSVFHTPYLVLVPTVLGAPFNF